MIFDGLDALQFAAPTGTTAGTIALGAVGSSYTVAMVAGSTIQNGSTIFITDGTRTLTGTVTSGAGTTSLVILSTAGSTSGTMATASPVTTPGVTVVNDGNAQPTGAVLTATEPSLAIDLVDGGIGYTQPFYLVVRYSLAANASGSNTVQFNSQKSTDNITWFDTGSGAADLLTLTTTALSGVVNVPVETRNRYVRLNTVIGGAGSTPTVTILSCDLNPSPL